MRGFVNYFDKAKGWGFIRADDKRDYFFHWSDIVEKINRAFNRFDRVIFDPCTTTKGLSAANVRREVPERVRKMVREYVRHEPYTEADAYFADYRKPLGYCAECGYEVFKDDECTSDDDAPLMIERQYFHEKCVMPYARSHWKLS